MHAVFHILIFLLTNGWLPWLNLIENLGKTFLEQLKNRSEKRYTKKFACMVPRQLDKCLTKVFLLRYEEEPPYEEILKCLWQCFEDAAHKQESSLSKSNKKPQVNLAQQYSFEWNSNPFASPLQHQSLQKSHKESGQISNGAKSIAL